MHQLPQADEVLSNIHYIKSFTKPLISDFYVILVTGQSREEYLKTKI